VEWEITPWVQPGKENRLDLEMKVDTVSETLSYSSDYCVPQSGRHRPGCQHLRDSGGQREGDSPLGRSGLGLPRRRTESESDVGERTERAGFRPEPGRPLEGPDGKPVPLTTVQSPLDVLAPGSKTVELMSRVANPLKWSAEKPHLYKLALELKEGGKTLERIET